MVHKGYPENLARALMILIIFILAGRGIYDSLRYSGQLSPIADSYSEADTLRAGEGYFRNGFLSNAGLPEILYGDQFPDDGLASISSLIPEGSVYVYTRYPPGPNMLAGLLTKICGIGNLGCFRLFPTTIAIFSLTLFAWMLSSALGPVKSAIIMLAVAIVPMTSNMMHGLHCQSYAFSLLLIQLGLLLNIFKKKSESNAIHLFILFILAFLHGWLSFDYFFLVSLSALPLALLYCPLDQKEDKKLLLFAVLAPTIGFGFAHFLHFIQVVVYYKGSVAAAYNDIFGAAGWRFDDSENSISFITGRIILSLRYLFVFARQKTYFVINFPVLLAAVFILIWIKEARLITHKPFKIFLRWRSSGRGLYVIAAAFIVSFLWIIVMKQHAAEHTHFLPRHLFLLYFVCILTILECVSLDNLDNQESGIWKLRP